MEPRKVTIRKSRVRIPIPTISPKRKELQLRVQEVERLSKMREKILEITIKFF